MSSKRELERLVREEMEATGLSWALERGTKHIKLMLAGQFVGIMPGGSYRPTRGTKNILSQIRRKARELKENGRAGSTPRHP